MRKIEILGREFKNFVWPAIAFQPVENAGELDAHVRLLGKIKAASLAEPLENGANPDTTIANRRLVEERVTFSLEEDEWGQLKKQVKAWLPRIAGGVLDEFLDLRDRLDGAVKEEIE